ncbi:MAG: fibronectin type III domain-containing protein [Treponematales bacterium]
MTTKTRTTLVTGVTWTAVADTKFDGTGDIIYGIAYGGGKFVAGGYEGKAAYSVDGVT